MTDAHWTKAHKGAFDTPTNWSTGTVPGAGVNVFLDAAGKAYTVSATSNEAIGDLTVGANATLALKGSSAASETFTLGAGVPFGAGVETNAGHITVGDNASLEILAISNLPVGPTYVMNTGTIALNAKSHSAFIDVRSTYSGGAGAYGYVGLHGNGSIIMSDSAFNGIVDGGSGKYEGALIQNYGNTISGAGVIGDGGLANGVPMSFRNHTGVVDATGTNNPLILSMPGTPGYTGGLVNYSLIEGTGKAGLDISATTVYQHGGTIFAGDGSIVRLESARVVSGTLSSAGSGIVLASGGSSIVGSKYLGALTNAGVLQDLGETLYADGAITNTGAIRLSDQVTSAVMQVGGYGLTLSGAGSLTLTDFLGNAIQGDGSGSVFANIDNAIGGAGQIGGNGMGFSNGAAGVIDATGTYNTLKLYGPGLTFANSGLIEATGKAGLEIAAVTLDQSGGGQVTVAGGSILRLESASLIGGALTNAATGQIVASGGSSLAGVSVVNQGLLTVVDSDTLSAAGSIANSGTISLAGTGAGANLTLTGALTLSGGGKVLLGDDGASIGAAAAGDTLTNVDNAITGDGQLGGGSTTLINMAGGVIHETGAGGLLIAAATTTNAGLIEASGAGGISDTGVVRNSGTLEAVGGGMFSLVDGVNNTGVLKVNSGTLVAYKTVNGAGRAVIAGGTLEFAKVFDENVAFTGSSGLLDLARSRSYTHTVSGFSTTGGTSFDLGDVHFVSAGEATFSGTAAGGTLTITDGTDTAHIALSGDYLVSNFVASRDGHGGVIVKATTGAAAAPPPHAFIAAMAALAGPAAALHVPETLGHAAPPLIASPRTALA